MSFHEKVPSVLLIVMGVSGSGKSTTGAVLAKRLHSAPFLDADDLHPLHNVEKMSAGHPLTDEDRFPWLALVRSTADRLADPSATIKAPNNPLSPNIQNQGVPGQKAKIIVIACSALKRSYRDILRGIHPAAHAPRPPSDINPSHPVPDAHVTSTTSLRTYFVFIDGPREVLLSRMSARKDHFMKQSMLDSQLATLENPPLDGEEGDVVVVDLEKHTEDQVTQALVGLEQLGVRFGDRIHTKIEKQ